MMQALKDFFVFITITVFLMAGGEYLDTFYGFMNFTFLAGMLTTIIYAYYEASK